MNRKLRTRVYMGHVLIAWGGVIWQIIHTYSNMAVQLTLVLAVTLVLKEILAIPLASSSAHSVWEWHHKVSLILVLILLVGIVLYR